MLNQVIFHLLSGSLAESSFSKTFTIRLKFDVLFLNFIFCIKFPHFLKKKKMSLPVMVWKAEFSVPYRNALTVTASPQILKVLSEQVEAWCICFTFHLFSLSNLIKYILLSI